MKRTLATLLALALAFGLLAIMPLTASAAGPTAPSSTATWDFTGVDADGSGTGWTWVQTTRTLTLTNFTHSTTADVALRLPTGGATIVLNGANTVASTYSGVNTTRGIHAPSLTITGSGSLSATGGTGGAAVDFGSYGISALSSLTINGAATVTATGGTSPRNSAGLSSNGSITIGGTANVTATGGAAGENSRGISAASGVTISGGTVNAAGGAGDAGSYGLRGGGSTPITISGGMATAVGNTSAFATAYTVPSGYMYFVNAATAPSGAALMGNGSAAIGSAHKYAKVAAPIPSTYAVIVSSAGTGLSGSGFYAAGAIVSINAGTPPVGKVFKEWASSSTVTFVDKNSASTTFPMPGSAVTVTAVFENASTPARGIFGTKPQYNQWYHYILFFLCFGFIWMWF